MGGTPKSAKTMPFAWWVACVLGVLCTCAAIYLVFFGKSTSGRVTAVIGVAGMWVVLLLAARAVRQQDRRGGVS